MIDWRKYLAIFVTGGVAGWTFEVILRIILGNSTPPGLFGIPFLPLYGTGAIVIYLISSTKLSLPIKIILFAITTTLMELATGLVLLAFGRVLWDYSSHRLNYRGLISPLATAVWVAAAIAVDLVFLKKKK